MKTQKEAEDEFVATLTAADSSAVLKSESYKHLKLTTS